MTQKKHGVVFEISWEVCNMVGGIHTVIMSKAAQMRELYGDGYICIGPQVPHPISAHPEFHEEIWDGSLYKRLQDFRTEGVSCRMGRWLIPGAPKVLLIGFRELYAQKDRILSHYWERFGVNSLHGGYDYLEPFLFSHAAGLLIEHLHSQIFFPEQQRVLVHAHEWMSAPTVLHLRESAPEVSTVFTTHATILGRSLSSIEAGKPLPAYLREKSAVEWAARVGVESKHSLEAVAAREADCFTTVSETTADECGFILGKRPDLVVQNGLSEEVPSSQLLNAQIREAMHRRLLRIAQDVTGFSYDPANTVTVATSGRYEFKNKGIDLFLDALIDLGAQGASSGVSKRIVAFVMCPAGHAQRVYPANPSGCSTHQLVDPDNDPVLELLRRRQHHNSPERPVHIVFLPLYLSGVDPTLPETYWELLSGVDLAVFPSWYEPWGYTPHEAISLGIPTITTDCAGFGRWAQELPGGEPGNGVFVIDRLSKNETSRSALTERIAELLGHERKFGDALSAAALLTSKKLRWGVLISGYQKAYAVAGERSARRVSTSEHARFRSFSFGNVVAPSRFSHIRANVRNFSVNARFPVEERALRKFMECNISWTWNARVGRLLSKLDPALWEEVDHSARQFIKKADEGMSQRIASDPELKKLFEDARGEFQDDPDLRRNCVRAYFCMEYGITDKLRIYSGGLGILAGDHLKTASDMKVPLAAFGLFYQYGYFRQGLGPDGQQLAHYDRSELESLKLTLVQDDRGARLLLLIPFGSGEESFLYFQAWRLDLHGVHLYLLDSNVLENPARLRNVTDRLYGSEPGKRISQEWLLSMGGLELIKRLNLPIQVYHMNEGHTAFLVLGRTLDLMEGAGLTFDEAFEFVRFSTIFTTHTPVPAGHDEFELEEALSLIRKRVADPAILERVIALGASLKGMTGDNQFSMTGLALRGSRWVNAVSRIHCGVSQQMFNNLYPDLSQKEVPIDHVTNGVHVPFWVASEWQSLFYETLGDEWPQRLRDQDFWRKLENVPLERFDEIKKGLKNKLILWLRKRLGDELAQGAQRPDYAAVLARLDPRTLVIAHAKRMAPYKRADLLFQQPDELFELLKSSPVPILFLYSGKAHPSDGIGQEILQRISKWSRDPRFLGSVLLLEDYDLSYARRLLAGCDLWLNTPLRPLEASGTSGMKAAMNGTLHFSVADGWWPEVYNGKNGWMIGDGSETWEHGLQDGFDRSRILHVLKYEILRDYVPEGAESFSSRWAARMRDSIAVTIPRMSSQRMFANYEQKLYGPAIRAAGQLQAGGFADLRRLVSFKACLADNWRQLAFESINLDDLGGEAVSLSRPTKAVIRLAHPGLDSSAVKVQAILRRRSGHQHVLEPQVIELERLAGGPDHSEWRLSLENGHAGDYSLAFRAIAQSYPGVNDAAFELKLVKWM